MNNYLLTIIGSFESDDVCKDIALSITPIVDSPNLKFQHAEGVLIFHFASEVSQEEIHDYVTSILFGITESFILTEMTDKVSVSMPKDIKEHLFDLETTTFFTLYISKFMPHAKHHFFNNVCFISFCILTYFTFKFFHLPFQLI